MPDEPNPAAGHSYQIGDVGAGARVAQGENVMQTFSTMLYPTDSRLPEVMILWMRSDTTSHIANDSAEEKIKSLNAFLSVSGHENDDFRVIKAWNIFPYGALNEIESLMYLLLQSGVTGDAIFDFPNIADAINTLFNTVAVPVQNSPLKDMTLAGIISTSTGALAIEIVRNALTPYEATVIVLLLSGAIIALGAANAVRRACEVGIEIKLLSLFGIKEAKDIALSRLSAAETERSRVAQKRRRRSQLLDEGLGEGETIERQETVGQTRERHSS